MDYYIKYMKYKTKYISLKNENIKNMNGGSYNYLNFLIGVDTQKTLEQIKRKMKKYYKNNIYLIDDDNIDYNNFILTHTDKPIIFFKFCNDECDNIKKSNIKMKYYVGKNYTLNETCNDIIKIINREQIPKFPYKKGVDMRKIKLTEEGKYSYTKTKHGLELMKYMKNKINNLSDLTILDGTANMGSDTILFSLNCKNVISIELNKENYNALIHNTSLYKQNNIEIHNGDTTKLIFDLCFDILYLDPPWGGENYKENDKIDLYLGVERVDLFIKEVIQNYKKCDLKYIILKMPKNYNFDRFKNIGKYNEITNIGPLSIIFIKI